jgi:hypothetical protein
MNHINLYESLQNHKLLRGKILVFTLLCFQSLKKLPDTHTRLFIELRDNWVDRWIGEGIANIINTSILLFRIWPLRHYIDSY